MWNDPSGLVAEKAIATKTATVALLMIAAFATIAYWSATPAGQDALTQMSIAMGHAFDDATGNIGAIFSNADNARSTVTSFVDSIIKDYQRGPTSGHSVYVLIDSSSKVRYVGRTNNVARRERAHQRPLSPTRHYSMVIVKTELSRESARAWEQMLIGSFTLSALDNARNEIAAGNIIGFSSELDRAFGIASSGGNIFTAIDDFNAWLF